MSGTHSLRGSLPAPLAARARAFSRDHGVTLSQTLLAAFEVLARRLGAPSGAPTVRELLARVRQAGADAFAHRELPLDGLPSARRASARPAGCPVSFHVQDDASIDPSLSVAPGGDALRVAVSAADEGEVAITWAYDGGVFDAETVARLDAWFRTLLGGMMDDADRSILDLPVLEEAEAVRVLKTWNATARAFADARPVHRAVAEQAARTPDAVAVHAEAGSLTYRELDALAGRVARRLGAAGVGAEDRVAVCLERSAELPAVLLGILRAGASYVPLDPGYPAERIAYVLADCGAALLVTHSALASRLPAGAAEGALFIDRITAEPDDSAEPPADAAQAESVAYLIYTSGSTGRPKGVAVPHGALANHMAWMRERFPLTPADRVLQKTPVMFDASVWEFWAPLMAGARLVMARPGGERDAGYLVSTLVRERITVLQVVPTLLRMLAEEPGLEDAAELRLLFCGGEALPRELVARVSGRIPAEIHNLYGPTEACIDASSHRADTAGPAPTVSIGAPISNTRMYVLDARLQPVPVQAPGELFVGGAGLARGYHGRPSLTAERFVPDPFAPAPGARMYRTGDRVRWNPDGTLEYLGRLDHQVKVRGHRIEPGEIEAVLAAHPAVREAAVLAADDGTGTARLAAYVVPAAGASLSVDDLRAHLRAGLPEHMVPSAFVTLERLPLMPNGKLDRAALPAPGAAAATGAYAAPRNATEEALAAIWAEVLGVEQVGIHDDFIALGGHSLLATQVLRRARAALGLTAPVAALFQHPTVAGLAAVLAPETETAGPVRRIEPVRDAAALLEDLDALSPEEIDALLGSLASEP